MRCTLLTDRLVNGSQPSLSECGCQVGEAEREHTSSHFDNVRDDPPSNRHFRPDVNEHETGKKVDDGLLENLPERRQLLFVGGWTVERGGGKDVRAEEGRFRTELKDESVDRAGLNKANESI